ncbi:MAG: class I SAM-dependent methyltransferase [Methanomicrobiales archaeon]
MENVKNHFEEEAVEFDRIIKVIIPSYLEMIESLVSVLPFHESSPINVLDLGCGTGNVSKQIKNKFPNSKITCLDLAEKMIDMAKIKLSPYNDITYKTIDFRNFNFKQDFDVIISSLAIHHLTNQDKQKIYQKIYDSLHLGGVFYNADILLGSNEKLQDVYMDKWNKHMMKKISKGEIESKWLPKHKEEDIPAKITDHLEWMEKAGFKEIDVVWKYYYFGVYGGTKL